MYILQLKLIYDIFTSIWKQNQNGVETFNFTQLVFQVYWIKCFGFCNLTVSPSPTFLLSWPISPSITTQGHLLLREPDLHEAFGWGTIWKRVESICTILWVGVEDWKYRWIMLTYFQERNGKRSLILDTSLCDSAILNRELENVQLALSSISL